MKKNELVFSIPGSKSIINRLLIMATYLNNPLTINNFSNCSDVMTLLENIELLGFEYKLSDGSCTLTPQKTSFTEVTLKIQDAGTAYRFLLARLAGWNGLKSDLYASKQLSKRPVDLLIDKLNSCGAKIQYNDSVKIYGKKISAVSGNFKTTVSSQFISSIMLMAPLLRNGIDLQFTDKPVSYDYLVLTKNVLQLFGIKARLNHRQVYIKGDQNIQSPGAVYAESDYSSASYFWALGALISLPVGVYTTGNVFNQSDYNFWKILEKMGAEIYNFDDRILVKRKELHGININMNDMPDQVPTLAVISLFANSKTTISGIDHLRFKESDRISALVCELSKLGADVRYQDSMLTINPLRKGIPKKIILNTYNDHRLVMAFSLLTLIFPDLKLDSISSVSKSFPEFFRYWQQLGENLDIKNSLKDITKYE